MTGDPFPPSPALDALDRRFPDRLHLWAGRLRVWRVEYSPPQTSQLRAWVARATPFGAPDRLLGLPSHLLESKSETNAERRTETYLDLPIGLLPTRVPDRLPPWPDATPTDVPATLRGDPPTDWRSVRIIRAEAIRVVAIARADSTELYSAGREWAVADEPIVRVPGIAFAVPEVEPPAEPGWNWLGDGPMRAVRRASPVA